MTSQHLTGRYMRIALGTAGLLQCLIILTACQEQGIRLPAVEARIDRTSVSGISAGAYMAGQFQMAHSRDVVGAAIVAGGPYACAESFYADIMPGPGGAFLNLSKAMNGCMLDALLPWGIPDPVALSSRARQLAEQGRIDPIESVLRHRVYLFAGREDRTVVPAIVRSAAEFYRALGVPTAQITFVNGLSAGHAFVTADKGLACDRTGSPYIVDCDYDQAGSLLAHIYGYLAPKAARPGGEILSFDQREFFSEAGDHGLSDSGAVYIPASCRSTPGCQVHISFHGCGQNTGAIGNAYIVDTGFLPWADTNQLIILFPQVKRTPSNPQACWDWWGYTGREFLTQRAPQVNAVRKMLERLTEPRSMI